MIKRIKYVKKIDEEDMEQIKNLEMIIEQASCVNPACKNCVSYKNNGCTFGCLNERVRLTAPNYSCNNFNARYSFNESTLDALKDLLKDAKRVNEGLKNFELLLSEKITEKDFVEMVD